MKTDKNLRLLRPAMALLALAPFMMRAAETPAVSGGGETTEPATHVLFTATNIEVVHEGTLCPVCGVDGGSFIVTFKNRNIAIPMWKNPAGVKMSDVQQLTARAASVTDFKYDRGYSAARDPYKKWSESMMDMQKLKQDQSRALRGLQVTRKTMIGLPGPGGGQPADTGIPNPAYQDAQRDFNNTSQTLSGDLGSNAGFAQKMADELALKLFDVVEVQFEIYASKPIRYPYIVIVAKYHEKDDPKHPQNWVFAKTIDPIDTTPRKVTAREGGFPLGFEVEKLQVHLYENGVEVATNLSENRATLTREEAHEYSVIDYVSTHKGATATPQLAFTITPEDWATHPKDDSFRKLYYVKVDKTGHPVGCFEDASCSVSVKDQYYDRVLKDMLFLPALEKGQAVEGVASIKLGEIII
jgi:hypothetical protein